MLVTTLTVEGLRHAEPAHVDGLDRMVRLPAGSGSVALSDGLELFAASLSETGLMAAVHRLGLATADTEVLVEDGLPVEVSGLDGAAVQALVTLRVDRAFSVRLELTLDPVLYGELRHRAIRDPKLVTALSAGGHLTVKLGWMFTSDWTTASVAALEVAVGDLGFPVTGKERPIWLTPLLARLPGRIARLHRPQSSRVVARQLLGRATSTDPAERARFRRVEAAVQAPPFSLPRPELVGLEAPELCFGAELLRCRQVGAHALEVVALCDAALGEQADVLVVERPAAALGDDDAVLAWLEARTEGNEATLEQVFVVGGPA